MDLEHKFHTALLKIKFVYALLNHRGMLFTDGSYSKCKVTFAFLASKKDCEFNLDNINFQDHIHGYNKKVPGHENDGSSTSLWVFWLLLYIPISSVRNSTSALANVLFGVIKEAL